MSDTNDKKLELFSDEIQYYNNEMGINFYNKQGYHTRGLIDIKKL